MKYFIDYRQGSMGNTILAHVLFSCKQTENLTLEDFFSATGDSHKIRHYLNTELGAAHLIEFPDKNKVCVLQVKSSGWFEVLRYKMAYVKWFRDYPRLDNWQKFNIQHKTTHHNKILWQEFYQNIKDPAWPECDSFEESSRLPQKIQQEIKNLYRIPNSCISSSTDLLEFLTLYYYDGSKSSKFDHMFDVPKLDLSDYLSYNLNLLHALAEQLQWQWHENLSEIFFQAMMKANQIYMAWLRNMIDVHDSTILGKPCSQILEIWEQALVVAQCCQTLDLDPSDLEWQNIDCDPVNRDAILVKLLGT